jgi:hypothetical protein
MLMGPFLGLALPLLPAQILWVNLLTHGLPGVGFGAEQAEPDVLSRPAEPADGGGAEQTGLVGGGDAGGRHRLPAIVVELMKARRRRVAVDRAR